MSGYNPYEEVKNKVIRQIHKDITNLDKDDDMEILDSNWLSNKFMVPAKDIDPNFRVQSYKCSAHYKFQDTTLGGHRACNPPAQFTRYADIRANDFWYPWDPLSNVQTVDGGKVYTVGPDGNVTDVISNINFMTTTSHTGMGRYYSEALDDGWQEIYLTFGLPKFNGLLDFFKSAITYEDMYIAKHGRVPTTYNVLSPIASAVTFAFMPGLTILSFFISRGFDLIAGNKPYNYYYLEPAMHLFWSSCNNIANQIATAMGILAIDNNNDVKDQSKAQELVQGKVLRFDSDMKKLLQANFHDMDVFGTANYIDIYSMITRYQNRVNSVMKIDLDDLANQSNPFGTLKEMQEYQNKTVQSMASRMTQYTFLNRSTSKMPKIDMSNNDVTFEKDSERLIEKAPHLFKKEDPNALKGPNPDTLPQEDSNFFLDTFGRAVSWVTNAIKSKWNNTTKVFDASSRLATSQVIFLVQPTGATSESFSNSVGEINTGGTIKSLGQAAHNANFNFAGGRLGIGPIDALIDGAKQAGMALIDSFTFGASNLVRGLLAGGYMDIPKMWQDSDCSFPNVTYSMDLIAPYGHPYSRFQNIVVPISILLTGALPMKVGKASYTSPFLCSCFCQGVQHIRLGMITDLSITRGGGSMQQTFDRKTNFVSVSFSITDFGHKINAPINTTIFSKKFFPILEEETPFADYIDMLTGKHISDVKWAWPNIKQRFSNMLKMRGPLNPVNIAGMWGRFIGDTWPLSTMFHYPASEGNNFSI